MINLKVVKIKEKKFIDMKLLRPDIIVFVAIIII
jgi:hypothetical protein